MIVPPLQAACKAGRGAVSFAHQRMQILSQQPDPFAAHPELRDRIVDPAQSFFRDFSLAKILAQFPQLAAAQTWAHSDAYREENRAKALAGHCGDLWIFGYGSLMWDPALRFVDLRRARVQGFARRLILMDVNGGRGTRDAPGLMAALDRGDHCDGLAFRIAAGDVDRETEILWRREVIGPGYVPAFVTADLAEGPVQALTFLADHGAREIRADLSRAEQIDYIAHGAGFLGTSRAYLANIVDHFAALDIHDEDCITLLREVDQHLSAQGASAARTATTGP
jgi:glutathione-specific gamma-glutamylcyclotransferase